MTFRVAPLFCLIVATALLAFSMPARVIAQNSACNPEVQTCL